MKTGVLCIYSYNYKCIASFYFYDNAYRLTGITQGGSTTTLSYYGGYQTSDGVKTYVWDGAGRLRTISDASGTIATYTYDAQHHRTKKVAGASTTHYVYGAGGVLYGEYTSTGALVREYVYLHGRPLAQVDSGSPETITYLHTDHLGTPRAGSNSSGASVWAWSAANNGFGATAPTGTKTVNLRFAGQYFDSESGLFYNWNRYYNPSTGRYISSDPIGLSGGLNTFAYAAANPVMFTDPEGLRVIEDKTICVMNPILCILDGIINSDPPALCPSGTLPSMDNSNNANTADDAQGDNATGAESPEVNPQDVKGKTPEEIEAVAKGAGLTPKGPDPKTGKGSWIDPKTGKQRILCHPNCADPHAHVNNPNGERLDENGNVVDPESPEAHLPIK